MRKVHAFAACAATSLLMACYVDPSAHHRQEARGHQPDQVDIGSPGLSLDGTGGVCRFGVGRGCFDGYLSTKKEFFIDGKAFFNSDDLAARFKDLITVATAAKTGSPAGAYQVALTTPVDNVSFAQSFEYVLTGALARSGKVRADGSFSINDLPDGTYDLRVFRAVRFQVTMPHPVEAAHSLLAAADTSPAIDPTVKTPAPPTAPTPTTPANPQPAPAPAPQPTPGADTQTPGSQGHGLPLTKVYCATVYADATLDVQRGHRTFETFSDFRLHVTDSECASAGGQATVSIGA